MKTLKIIIIHYRFFSIQQISPFPVNIISEVPTKNNETTHLQGIGAYL